MRATRKWTSEDEGTLKNKLTELSNYELAVLLGRSVGSIENKLNKLHLVRPEKEYKSNKLDALTKRAYTEQELRDKFDFDFSYVEENCPEGFTVYYVEKDELRAAYIQPDFKAKITLLPKKYKATLQPDGQPYLWIKLFDNKERIKIVPISDVHYGHNKCNVPRLKRLLEYIKDNDDVYAFINGDLIENSSKHSVGSGVYEQNGTPTTQLSEILSLLAPIAHKILWSIGGNHEERSYREVGIDIGQFIASQLEIPYFDEPVYVDIFWGKNCFKVFDQHGASGSVTIGGKMNKAMAPAAWNDFTNFFIMGHVHDKINKDLQKIIRNQSEFRLEFKKQYVVVCASFLDYFGTYGARKGYAPTSLGLTSLKLYKNGDYHTGD